MRIGDAPEAVQGERHRVPLQSARAARNASGAFEQSLFRSHVQQYARGIGNVIYLEICPQKACATTWSSKETNGWIQEIRFQPMDSAGSGPYSLTVDPQTGWNPSENTYETSFTSGNPPLLPAYYSFTNIKI